MGLFAVLLLLTVLASTLHAEVIVKPDSPRPGDPVIITANSAEACRARLIRDGTSYPMSRSDTTFRTLIGIDVEQNPGPLSLSIHMYDCRGRPLREHRVRFTVEDRSYRVQRITLKDSRRVHLSEADLRRHRKESRKIDDALTRRHPRRWWSWPFHFPLERKQTGNSFGSRRIINGEPRKPHTGEDYSANIGEPVYAINRGVVSLTGNFFFSGRSIFIDHGHGLHSMYFHLSEMLVEKGETVRAGQKIGTVGRSGRASGPHLHLGIRLRGARVDPDRFWDPSWRKEIP